MAIVEGNELQTVVDFSLLPVSDENIVKAFKTGAIFSNPDPNIIVVLLNNVADSRVYFTLLEKYALEINALWSYNGLNFH